MTPVTKLGFGSTLALLVLLLVASRGAIGGVYEYVSDLHWVAGASVLLLASVIPVWLVLRYVGSRSEE